MKLYQKIARGLRRRQVMPEQQCQRPVLAKLLKVFRPLATGRPQRQQAFRHLRGTQTPLATLQLDLSVDHRCRPGLAKRLDQPGHPGMPGDQPCLQLAIDLEIQPRRLYLPRTPWLKFTTRREQKKNQPLRCQIGPNPNPLAGDQGSAGALAVAAPDPSRSSSADGD